MMLFHDVPLQCINQSAANFHIPAMMIVSVIQIENGKNGQAVKNKDGTFDLGVMQINSTWIKKLNAKGIKETNVQFDPCTNVAVGAWILAQGISNSAGWQGVGNYHSYTPKHNAIYREKVRATYVQNSIALRDA